MTDKKYSFHVKTITGNLHLAIVIVPDGAPSQEAIRRWGKENASWFEPAYTVKRLIIAGSWGDIKKQLEDRAYII